MRFLPHWPDTKPPTALRLVDIALIAALLPHLSLLEPMMLIYLGLSWLLIWRAKPLPNRHLLLMALIGGVALALSFFESFTFVGLSRLNIFVSLVVSLLIVAVVLQRLTQTLNFYLALSPILFLALSYFFHHSIMMLLYALFTLLLFLALLLWYKMQSPLIDALKTTLAMAAFSLPSIVLLFLIFPRISFETKEFGFKTAPTIRTGHDGLMHLGDEALLIPSTKVVMELFFPEGIPPDHTLYFRGSTLYVDQTSRWEPLATPSPRLNTTCVQTPSRYQVTLYPHRKRWLFALDYPCKAPAKATLNEDAIVSAELNVDTVLRYEGASIPSTFWPHPKLPNALREAALRYNQTRDERLYALAHPLSSIPDPRQKLAALEQTFRALGLYYSLDPQGINPADPNDSFLFDTKKGYCVHFAGAFATMARMSGLPARVLTGFKADRANAYNNYLIVRENDAHAWVEVYIEDQGWQRVEPTRFAIGDTTRSDAPTALQTKQKGVWGQAQLVYMYVRYRIQAWVLDYNRSKQMQLLRTLLDDAAALALAVTLLGALLFLAYAARSIGASKRKNHPAKVMLAPLLQRLQRQGLVMSPHETMETFLRRSGIEGIEAVIEHYNEARYADHPQALEHLLDALQRLNKK